MKDINMRDVSTVKLMLFQSFIFLIFTYVAIKNFDWMFFIKFDESENVLFFKNLNKNVSNFVVYIIKFI